jgi:hypothetical protein
MMPEKRGTAGEYKQDIEIKSKKYAIVAFFS